MKYVYFYLIPTRRVIDRLGHHDYPPTRLAQKSQTLRVPTQTPSNALLTLDKKEGGHMKKICILLAGLGVAGCLGTPAPPHQIKVDGSYKHTSPVGQWSRGMPTTMYCGNSPESWVRGNVTLDPSSGLLSMTVQLETDSVSAGPKGKVTAALKDSGGKTLVTATSDEIGTGGKDGTHASIRNFTSATKIDPSIAKQVRLIHLDAQCTGSMDRLLNIKLDTVNDAFKIAVVAASM